LPNNDVVAGAPAASSPSASPVGKKHTMYASWYDVPADSVAARRALPGELTAAHDDYRLGTRLRVTHAGNGRSVVVRVTDRGVPRRKAPLDLCKRAAEELDMVREGTAKVRVEVLPEEQVDGAVAADSPNGAAQP
jgi:rare lipoprotein A